MVNLATNLATTLQSAPADADDAVASYGIELEDNSGEVLKEDGGKVLKEDAP